MSERPPAALTQLLAWFRSTWEAELPDRVHVRGVWHDDQASSALGSPALSPGFSSYLWGSPFATDFDPRQDTWTSGSVRLRPFHAVLAEMTGRDPDGDGAFRARWLLRVACMGWDVEAASRDIMPPQVARSYTRDTLERAWVLFHRHKEREVA